MRIQYMEGNPCAEKYILGTMRRAGFEDVVSTVAEPLESIDEEADLFLICDYPASNIDDELADDLVRSVEAGAGLILSGGWTSFGRGGYARSRIADLLPVELEDGDDRTNTPSGTFLMPLGGWEFAGESGAVVPPVVTGFNSVKRTRPGTVTAVVGAVVDRVEKGAALLREDTVPILILGSYGRGAVAALTTDLAPHWSGGWTDWGGGDIDIGQGEQVGHLYLAFLKWLCLLMARQPQQVSP